VRQIIPSETDVMPRHAVFVNRLFSNENCAVCESFVNLSTGLRPACGCFSALLLLVGRRVRVLGEVEPVLGGLVLFLGLGPLRLLGGGDRLVERLVGVAILLGLPLLYRPRSR